MRQRFELMELKNVGRMNICCSNIDKLTGGQRHFVSEKGFIKGKMIYHPPVKIRQLQVRYGLETLFLTCFFFYASALNNGPLSSPGIWRRPTSNKGASEAEMKEIMLNRCCLTDFLCIEVLQVRPDTRLILRGQLLPVQRLGLKN